MSEIERNAAIEATARHLYAEFASATPASFDDLELLTQRRWKKIVRAAILAYEQHRGKQEPVGCIVRHSGQKDGRARRRFHFAEDGNFTVEEGYTITPVYASPQPADVGALRDGAPPAPASVCAGEPESLEIPHPPSRVIGKVAAPPASTGLDPDEQLLMSLSREAAGASDLQMFDGMSWREGFKAGRAYALRQTPPAGKE